jgi:hypothetical protein
MSQSRFLLTECRIVLIEQITQTLSPFEQKIVEPLFEDAPKKVCMWACAPAQHRRTKLIISSLQQPLRATHFSQHVEVDSDNVPFLTFVPQHTHAHL